jgi:site-specific recombinase
MTEIFRSCSLSNASDRKTFEVITSTITRSIKKKAVGSYIEKTVKIQKRKITNKQSTGSFTYVYTFYFAGRHFFSSIMPIVVSKGG